MIDSYVEAINRVNLVLHHNNIYDHNNAHNLPGTSQND